MSTTTFNSALFEDSLSSHCQFTLEAFKKISRFYTLFHLLFFTLAIGEIIGFLLFFSFFTKSSMLAFSLAGLFLTGFSYFVLLFYFQAKKPEQLIELRTSFLEACAETLPFSKTSTEYHQALAHAIYRLVGLLDKQEYYFYSLHKLLETLTPVLQKFSSWSHWKDTHQMKEKLLFVAIQQHIEQIKLQPTDLEAHGALANAYLLLARLYRDPRKLSPEEPFPWISPEYGTEAMLLKFRKASERAIEEFKILDCYAPGDSWTHAQLAAIYHDLEMPEEEIREYETMLQLAPDDQKILFRLGILYFEQGQNAKALRIYETLRGTAEADELIGFYDAYSMEYTSS